MAISGFLAGDHLSRALRVSAETDAKSLEARSGAVSDLLACPLWAIEKEPNELIDGRVRILEQLKAGSSQESFWDRWWAGMLAGDWTDWDLCRDIALIPDDTWKEGPAAVADAIREIEAKHAEQRFPVAERVEPTPDGDRLRIVPLDISNGDLLSTGLDAVETALDRALRRGGNGLMDSCYEVEILRDTITRFANNPQRVEMDLMLAAKSLHRQVETKEYADSPEVLGLIETCQTSALDIRATHPPIAEARDLRLSQSLREMTDEQKELLEVAEPVIAPIETDELREEMREDIRRLAAPTGPVPRHGTLGPAERNPGLVQVDAANRVFSRGAKMWRRLKEDEALREKLWKRGVDVAQVLGALSGVIMLALTLLG